MTIHNLPTGKKAEGEQPIKKPSGDVVAKAITINNMPVKSIIAFAAILIVIGIAGLSYFGYSLAISGKTDQGVVLLISIACVVIAMALASKVKGGYISSKHEAVQALYKVASQHPERADLQVLLQGKLPVHVARGIGHGTNKRVECEITAILARYFDVTNGWCTSTDPEVIRRLMSAARATTDELLELVHQAEILAEKRKQTNREVKRIFDEAQAEVYRLQAESSQLDRNAG